jgi:hypothetical protein
VDEEWATDRFINAKDSRRDEIVANCSPFGNGTIFERPKQGLSENELQEQHHSR